VNTQASKVANDEASKFFCSDVKSSQHILSVRLECNAIFYESWN